MIFYCFAVGVFFFGENFTDYTFKTQFTPFPRKDCTNLCTYDKINVVTPTVNK